MTKQLYFILGWFFFLLGGAGAFLPVLPTTPFMLLALWAFSKSSEHLHDWLYNHRIFGPPLQQWQEYRVIPRMAKFMAATVMLLSGVYLVFFVSIHPAVKIAAILLMGYGLYFILSKPSRIPGKRHQQ